MIAGETQDTPGWYGKLPSLGDFASRRLPDEFIRTWDGWLQEVLSATQARLGEGWLDCYLTMPIWRFALLPGLVGPSGWAGVLMPSVDRVGRQFPLTLAVELPSPAATAQAVFQAADWFADMEVAALSALDATRGPDDLDGAMADCAFSAASVPDLDGAVGTLRRLPSAEAFELLARVEAIGAWGRDAGWKGLWWTRGRVDGDALFITCAELPTAEEFAWLVQSRLSPAPSPGAAGATPGQPE